MYQHHRSSGITLWCCEETVATGLTAQLEAVLDSIEILPFDAPADTIYGRIRTQLEKAGTPIGSNDLLSAAHALSHGYTIVTANKGEFARIHGLSCENWLED